MEMKQEDSTWIYKNLKIASQLPSAELELQLPSSTKKAVSRTATRKLSSALLPPRALLTAAVTFR